MAMQYEDLQVNKKRMRLSKKDTDYFLTQYLKPILERNIKLHGEDNFAFERFYKKEFGETCLVYFQDSKEKNKIMFIPRKSYNIALNRYKSAYNHNGIAMLGDEFTTKIIVGNVMKTITTKTFTLAKEQMIQQLQNKVAEYNKSPGYFQDSLDLGFDNPENKQSFEKGQKTTLIYT